MNIKESLQNDPKVLEMFISAFGENNDVVHAESIEGKIHEDTVHQDKCT